MQALLPVPKADARGTGGVHHVTAGIDQLDLPHGTGLVATPDIRVHQADHAAKISRGDQTGRRHSEASAENAVKRRGRAAALDVSENGDSNLALGDAAD